MAFSWLLISVCNVPAASRSRMREATAQHQADQSRGDMITPPPHQLREAAATGICHPSRTSFSRTETEAHLEAAQANTGLRARLSATMMTGMATSQPRMACPSAAKPFPEKMSCRHTATVGRLQQLVTGAARAPMSRCPRGSVSSQAPGMQDES